ncbi:uncharacterized protein THITE_10741, partial [Thermothielavioides terrestris NRRL 8126]
PMRRSRRLKIAIACERCRISKKKCDGARPACNLCVKRRSSCSYRPGPFWATTSQSIQVVGRGHSGVSSPGSKTSPHSLDVELQGSCGSDLTESTDPPSGVVHGAFAGEVKAAIDARLGIAPSKRVIHSAPLSDAPLFDLRLDIDPLPGGIDHNVLPQRRHADRLVDLFWQYIQPLEPMLEPGLFSRLYEAVFAGHPLQDHTDERIFLSTLNTVFALSTQLQENVPTEERNRAGNAYFRRAWALLRVETVLWQAPSVELVQSLLLAARYLQCSSNPHQTWMAVGIAVRMAQSIGLDKASASVDDPSDRVPRSFKEQLWQCCVYMDRMTSWGAGRTPMVMLPSPLPVTAQPSRHATQGDGGEGGSGVDQTGVYLAKIMELYEVSNHISLSHMAVRSNVPDKLGLPPLYRVDDHFSNVSRFDACLDRWADSLPRSLRHGHVDARVDPWSYKQALLLQLRLIHGRISLFRPLLARHCLSRRPVHPPASTTTTTNPTSPDRSGSNSLHARIVRDCALLCVENAQKLIALVDDACLNTNNSNNHEPPGGSSAPTILTIPWWYRLFYLHVAATAQRVEQQEGCAAAAAVVSESWARARAALRAHEHLCPAFVGQCLAMFERVSSAGGQCGDAAAAAPAAAAVVPWQDVLFQDLAFDPDALLFGLEDMS